MEAHPLLKIENLKTYFYVKNRVARAVDDVSLAIAPGETLGLVGESGCGKSVTAHSIIQLIPDPPGKIVDGRIWFDDQDLLRLSEAEMRKIRGNRISMIFQEPMTALNPVYPVGAQVAEMFILHQNATRKSAWEQALNHWLVSGSASCRRSRASTRFAARYFRPKRSNWS